MGQLLMGLSLWLAEYGGEQSGGLILGEGRGGESWADVRRHCELAQPAW